MVGQLNIPEKITQLVEVSSIFWTKDTEHLFIIHSQVCQKHLKICQDKAGEIGQGIGNFAKQTTDDFLAEFGLLKSEVKKLSQEVAKEVRNKASKKLVIFNQRRFD